MTVIVEKFQDEPIIIATLTEPMDFHQDIPNMFTRILELRDSFQGYPHYYTIVDMAGIKASFSDVVFSLGEARKASQKRRPDFPNKIHLVGSGDIFVMVANALAQLQYGGYSALLHASAEDALDAIHMDLGIKKQ